MNMISHSKPWIDSADVLAVNEQLSKNLLANGTLCNAFEKKLEKYYNQKHFFATCSGSNALFIALLALNIKDKDDEVILPAYVCCSVLDAVKFCGARPVLCDIDQYWCMTANNIEHLINSNTKAIIVVHPMGIYCDVKQFKQYNLPIIEDCCQCFSANINGNKPGMLGDIAVFSFHATKCLTTGEGGAISTNNEYLATKIKSIIRNKAIASPMSDFQAALGVSQLKKYNQALTHRREIAQVYFKSIHGELVEDFLKVKNESMFFRFLLTTKSQNFEVARKKMHEKGIAIRRGIDSVLKTTKSETFENAENALNKTISIPIYPSLTKRDVETIIKYVNEYLTR